MQRVRPRWFNGSLVCCFGKTIRVTRVTFDLRSLACSLSSEQSAIKELATPFIVSVDGGLGSCNATTVVNKSEIFSSRT